MAKYRTTLRTARMNVIVSAVPNNASVRAYSGTVPAIGDAISGQTFLAERLMSGAIGTVTNGVLTNGSYGIGAVYAAGTPTFVRVVDASSPTTTYLQFTAGVGSGEWQFSAPFQLADTWTGPTFTITDGNT